MRPLVRTTAQTRDLRALMFLLGQQLVGGLVFFINSYSYKIEWRSTNVQAEGWVGKIVLYSFPK